MSALMPNNKVFLLVTTLKKGKYCLELSSLSHLNITDNIFYEMYHRWKRKLLHETYRILSGTDLHL